MVESTDHTAKKNTPGTMPAAIDALLAVLHSHDGQDREHARQALVAIGRPVVLPLIDLLTDPHHQARWEAAKALVEIHDPQSAPALVARLEDEEFDIRWLAAEGLIALGREGLTPLLQTLVKRGDSVWLRQGAHHVISALSERGLPGEVSAILMALEDGEPALATPLAAQTALDALRGPSGK